MCFQSRTRHPGLLTPCRVGLQSKAALKPPQTAQAQVIRLNLLGRVISFWRQTAVNVLWLRSGSKARRLPPAHYGVLWGLHSTCTPLKHQCFCLLSTSSFRYILYHPECWKQSKGNHQPPDCKPYKAYSTWSVVSKCKHDNLFEFCT